MMKLAFLFCLTIIGASQGRQRGQAGGREYPRGAQGQRGRTAQAATQRSLSQNTYANTASASNRASASFRGLGEGCSGPKCPTEYLEDGLAHIKGGLGDIHDIDALKLLKLNKEKCPQKINLIQCVAVGSTCDEEHFSHVKRNIHTMLDGFIVSQSETRIGVIISTSDKTKVVIDMNSSEGTNIADAKYITGSMKKLPGEGYLEGCYTAAADMIHEDHREDVAHVMIIHTDGDVYSPPGGGGSENALHELQQSGMIIPMVVAYGKLWYTQSYKVNRERLVLFCECSDIEFCPNFIITKYSSSYCLNVVKAAKRFIAAAVHAMPQCEIIQDYNR